MPKNFLKKIFGAAKPGDEKPDIWDKRRGSRYAEFWHSVAETREGAMLTTFGAPEPEEGVVEVTRHVGEYLVDALNLTSESKVLEVGCGMGRIAALIAPVVGEYHGADISPNMLEHSRECLAQADNCKFHVLKFSDLRDFESDSFDAVIFEAVLIHLAKDDSYYYMKETFRVLKPGGRAYFQVFNILHPDGLAYFKRIVGMCDHTGENLISRPRFHTAKEVRLYLDDIGFEIDEEMSRLEEVHQKNEKHEPHLLNAVVIKP